MTTENKAIILRLQQNYKQRKVEEEARGRESSEKIILELQQYFEKRRAELEKRRAELEKRRAEFEKRRKLEEDKRRKLDDDNEKIIEGFINSKIKSKTQDELEKIFSDTKNFNEAFTIAITFGNNKSEKDFIPYVKELLKKKCNYLEKKDLHILASCFYAAICNLEDLTDLKLSALPILKKIANSPATSVEGHSATPTQQAIGR